MRPALHSLARIAAATVAATALAFSASPLSAADFYTEDAVKAAYLYRFAGYIDWPEPADDQPFTIDVLDAPAVARELRRLLPAHPIDGRIAQVREITTLRDLGNARILYAAAGHAAVLRTLHPRTDRPAMLLVADEEQGLSMGAMLNFLTIDHTVRFEVSLAAAERWGLRISSELLGVAIRVQRPEGASFLGCGPAGDAPTSCAQRLARGVRYSLPMPASIVGGPS